MAAPHPQLPRNNSSPSVPALPYNGADAVVRAASGPATMENGKQWVGQIIDGKFRLQQYLGGTDHSAVFLTERTEEPRKAAIKLLQVAPENLERHQFQWRVATKLPHPHLLRIFETGQCEVGGNSLLYVVTEYAEENLADVLAQRALTPDETRDLLKPALDVLAYLHGKGFAHGDLRPTNILASGDQLKLASDSLSAVGGAQSPPSDARYAAPEQQQGKISAAADVWSLGMVLIEVLTAKSAWNPAKPQEPNIPRDLPEPYADIVHHCLRPSPQTRWTITAIRDRLEPKLASPPARVAPVAKPVQSKWVYVIASLVLVAALAAMLWPRGTRTASPKPEAAAPPAAKPTPVTPSKPVARAAATAKPAPAPAKPAAKAPGSVLAQVMPNAPQSALDTIQGRIRIAVAVSVDEKGNVVSTTLDSAGPSKYFARLALEAAQNWKFTPPQSDSGPQPSNWVIHFTLRSSGAEATAGPANR